MKKLYCLLLPCLLWANRLSAQLNRVSDPCGVTIIKTPDVTVLTCAADNITLKAIATNAPDDIDYTWSTGEKTPSIVVTAPGKYTVMITGTDGCADQAFVEITQNIVKPVVEADVVPSGKPICKGESATLVGAGVGKDGLYKWETDPPNGDEPLTGKSVVVKPPTSTTYKLTATAANGCTGTSTVTVSVNENLPDADILDPGTICKDNINARLTLKGSGGTLPYTFIYSLDGAIPIPNPVTKGGKDTVMVPVPTSAVKPLQYSLLSVRDGLGCSQALNKTFTLSITQGATLNSPHTASVCSGLPLNYLATSPDNVKTFTWTRPRVKGISNEENTGNSGTIGETLYDTISQPVIVTYYIRIEAVSGCVSNDVVQVTVNPKPAIDPVGARTYCNGTYVTGGIPFTTGAPNPVFRWENSDTSIGLPASGNKDIPAFNAKNSTNKAITATITVFVKASADNCEGLASTFTITVDPAPVLTSTKDTSICNISAFNKDWFKYTASSSAAATTFTWKRQLLPAGVSGSRKDTADVPDISDTLVNTGLQPATVRYAFTLSASASSACQTHDTITVKVNPTPSLYTPDDTTVCNGTFLSNGLRFSSQFSGTSFSWKSDNPNIGLPADSTGNIPAFIAKNNTDKAITATITVAPFLRAGLDSCAGVSTTFRITVRPAPVLTSTKDTSICNNSPFEYKALSSAEGTSFKWERVSDGNINGGLVNHADTSLIRETLVNARLLPVAVKYAFTLSALASSACQTHDTITVKVNPTPSINEPGDTTVCNGTFLSNGLRFSGTFSGTSFSWKSKHLNIGLPADSTGDIPPFNAKNYTDKAVTDTITVTPFIKAGSDTCLGASKTFYITVRPAPVLTSTKDTTICNISALNKDWFKYTASSSAAATTFTWKRLALPAGVSGSRKDTADVPDISDTLVNNGPQRAVVKYVFRLSSGSSCGITIDTLRVAVNPTPSVAQIGGQSNSLSYCNASEVPDIVFQSTTDNPVFTWTNSVKAIGLADSGKGKILGFVAYNQTNAALTANIHVKVSVGNGCPGDSTDFKLIVYPNPVLTSTKDISVCSNDSTLKLTWFNYTASSSATQTNFKWQRLPVTGIIGGRPDNGNTDIINEPLTDTLRQPVKVQYALTLSMPLATCSTTATLTVTVNPTPKTDTIAYDSVLCNGAPVNVSFMSRTLDSSFTWQSDTAIGFGKTGSGNIAGYRAANAGTAPVTAKFTVSVTASKNACRGADTSFTIRVLPSPQKESLAFTSLSGTAYKDPLTLCKGAENINFNINTPAPGATYTWSSSPGLPAGAIKNKEGANTVISLLNPGTYTIMLTASNSPYGCKDSTTQTVQVKDTIGIDKSPIFMLNNNVLFYPDKYADKSTVGYQWGYNLATPAVPDSIYGPPASIPGQVYNYFIPAGKFRDSANFSLNTIDYRYWVLLQYGSCATRIYYNGRYNHRAIPDTTVLVAQTVGLRIIPNPNSGAFDISLQGNIYGSITAQVYNALGQVVFTKKFTKGTAAVRERLNAPYLPAGVYLLMLHSSDLKTVQSRFVIQH